MRYIILLISLVLFTPKEEVRVPLPEVKCYYDTYFPTIYSKIRTSEGNYVFIKGDKGLETYGGISRRYYPNWYGWRYVDLKKRVRNEKVEEAEFWVLDHYLNIWVREGFYKVRDPLIAYTLFDFRIHSSPRTLEKKVNNVLNELGYGPVKVEGEWIDDRFNQLDPREFELLIKIQRLKLFNSLVARDSSQLQFYLGWSNRIGV
jgi:hypothetical protein